MHRAGVIYAEWLARHPNRGFPAFDSGIVRQANANDEEGIKQRISTGIGETTVTCVLIGAHTWKDRWVRYEIACTVERGNGLLGVRVNSIADPATQQKTVAGWNPLAYMGMGKIKSGDYLLFENSNGQWIRYQDCAPSLARPAYLPDMSLGYVQPLSVGLTEYDYLAQDGAEKLEQWIELAARKAGK